MMGDKVQMARVRKTRQNQPIDRDFNALAAQESFLRQVLDINPNLIFAKDREGRFTLVNQAVVRFGLNAILTSRSTRGGATPSAWERKSAISVVMICCA